MNRGRVFVDETKAKGYVVVAAAISPDDAAHGRRVVRALIAPGNAECI